MTKDAVKPDSHAVVDEFLGRGAAFSITCIGLSILVIPLRPNFACVIRDYRDFRAAVYDVALGVRCRR
jgi:hypothetical protein